MLSQVDLYKYYSLNLNNSVVSNKPNVADIEVYGGSRGTYIIGKDTEILFHYLINCKQIGLHQTHSTIKCNYSHVLYRHRICGHNYDCKLL